VKKIFNILGWVLSIYGILGYVTSTLLKGHEGSILSYGGFFGTFLMLWVNPFFWLGLIILSQTDKRPDTDSKPVWRKLYAIYIITSFGAIAVAVMLAMLTRDGFWLSPE